MGRGLSAEEKRTKLLEIFHETKDFYQLKELEKLGPKMKGIVSQSIKEVLQSLVDDGLVQSDKIGSSNFFWSFPSQRGAAITARVNAAKSQRESAQHHISELRNLIEQEKVVRPENAKRTELLAKVASKQKELVGLQDAMAQYGACNPVQIEAKKRGTILAREAAVRWTGNNLSLLKSNFIARTGANWTDIQTYLGIRDDFEDI